MPRRILTSFEMMRPHNMLAAALCVASGYRVAGGRDYAAIVIALLLTAGITGAGNIINDYFDVDIDRVNKPRRPLPSGRLTPNLAVGIYVVASIVMTVVALFTQSPTVAMVLVVWQGLLLLYAALAKRILVAGNLLVAVTTSSAFFLGALLAGAPEVSALPVAIAFLFVLSRELIKGAEDVEGDAPAGVQTVAVRFGVSSSRALASAIMLMLAVLIPLPAITRTYSRTYFWAMEGVVVFCLLISMYMMLRSPQRATFHRVSWILKAGMFVGVLAIAFA